jgi:hypothetical protein
VRLPFGASALLLCLASLAGCGQTPDSAIAAPTQAAAATKWVFVASGNAEFDAFQKNLEARDAKAISAEVAEFGSISGRPMPFADAISYLDYVKDCTVSQVVLPQNKFFKGRFELKWTCPTGEFRQAVDAVSRAPKITLSELY